MDALRVVAMERLVDGGGEFAERSETVRVAQVDLELVVEGLLVAVLPRTALLAAGDGNAKVCEQCTERLRVVFAPVVRVKDGRATVGEDGVRKGLDDERSTMTCRDCRTHHAPRIQVDCRRDRDIATLEAEVGEIGCPNTAVEGRGDELEQVRILLALWLNSAPFRPPPSVRLDAEELHDPQDGFFVSLQMPGDALVAVAREPPQNHFDLSAQCVITLWHLSCVVQYGA